MTFNISKISLGFAASVLMLSAAPAAFAQTALADEIYRANDIERDAFGEDYSGQRLEAAEGNRNLRQLSRQAHPFVSEAMQAGEEGEIDKMIAKVDKGLSVHGLTSYDEAILYQLRAAASIQKKDYAGAKKSYERAKSSGGMNREEVEKVDATLAKIEAVSTNS